MISKGWMCAGPRRSAYSRTVAKSPPGTRTYPSAANAESGSQQQASRRARTRTTLVRGGDLRRGLAAPLGDFSLGHASAAIAPAIEDIGGEVGNRVVGKLAHRGHHRVV